MLISFTFFFFFYSFSGCYFATTILQSKVSKVSSCFCLFVSLFVYFYVKLFVYWKWKSLTGCEWFFFVQRYICSAQSLPYPSQTLFIMDVLRDRNGFGLQTVGFRAESVYPCTRNARLTIKHVHFFASLPSSTLRIYTRSSPFIFVDRPRQKI